MSFYPVPAGASGGGVYFGKGAWLLPEQGPGRRSHSKAVGAPTELLSGPNRVLLEYLGEPVPPPANLEGAYTRDGLREAVQAAARKAGIATPQILIDDSEYPLLVGVVCQEGGFDRLKTQLGKVEAYEYHGGVGGHTRHAFNVTPFRVWPPEVQERASRRLMLRMQVLHDRLNEPE